MILSHYKTSYVIVEFKNNNLREDIVFNGKTLLLIIAKIL